MKKLALFSAPCKYIDDALGVIKKEKYFEWDLNTLPFALNMKRMAGVRDFIKEYQGEVRFHLPYSFWDLGVNVPSIASDSFNYYCRLFEMIKFLDCSIVVMHIGYATGSDVETSLKGLEKLAIEAKKYNVKLCIENLVSGLSSDMCFIKKCISINNVYFCLDTGHAEFLKRNGADHIYEDILSVKDKIIHAHVYDYEDENMNHIPLSSTTIEKNVWLNLLEKSNCSWYTMELDFQEQQVEQKKLLENYFLNLG